MERLWDRPERTLAAAVALATAFAAVPARSASYDDETRWQCQSGDCEVSDEGKTVTLKATPGSTVRAELGCPLGWTVARGDLGADAAKFLDVTAAPDGRDGNHLVSLRVPRSHVPASIELHCVDKEGDDDAKSVAVAARVQSRTERSEAPLASMAESVDLSQPTEMRGGMRLSASTGSGQVNGVNMRENWRVSALAEKPLDDEGMVRAVLGLEHWNAPNMKLVEGTPDPLNAFVVIAGVRFLIEEIVTAELTANGGVDPRGSHSEHGVGYGRGSIGVQTPGRGWHIGAEVHASLGARGNKTLGDVGAGAAISFDH